MSGGGIRSATFCYGIFNALARKQDSAGRPFFTRIDYLSTVSGGGFFGSFLGALFRRNWVKSADDVAAVLRGELGPKADSARTDSCATTAGISLRAVPATCW